MSHYLDLQKWSRRPHFEFFRKYEQPCFSVCVRVDLTAAYELRLQHGFSLFAMTTFAALSAANRTEAFRFRIRPDEDRAKVLVHPSVHGGSTVFRDDQTFGFGYFRFDSNFHRFASNVAASSDLVRSGPPRLDDQPERDDLIYFSVLPWLDFSSFSHARPHSTIDSIPRIVFGKHSLDGPRRSMPTSVEVHHALMDGVHVAEFLEHFQAILDEPRHFCEAESPAPDLHD